MRTRWTLATVAALALAWTVMVAEMPWVAAGSDFAPPDEEACAADAPEANLAFTLKDASGNDVNLADHKGKVVLLDFWATWCGPCKIEIPWFIEFQQKYGAQGLQVIGVSVDDTPDKLKPYIATMKMNYIVLQGLGHDDLLDAYGPMLGIPVTALISRDGRVCSKHTGLVSKETLEAQIKALL
jgi:thiol-disulfide isomerase/thioredoxin